MPRYRAFPNAALGHTLRAFRLGYRWTRHGYFLRISNDGGKRFRIDLAPADNVPKHKTSSGLHLVWWDAPDNGWDMIDQIKPLKAVMRVKKPISFCITEEREYAGL